MGLINEGGLDQPSLAGAVQGGTGVYMGALGTFHQVSAHTEGITPGRTVFQVVLDLLLPNLG